MKCSDVQNQLWSGRKSIEIQEHLATCAACQLEMAEIGDIIGTLQAIEVPVPSRSLIPNREIIRDTIRRNRRKPWTKLSAIAVAATIVLGIGTGLALNQLQLAPDRSMESTRTDIAQQETDLPQKPTGTNIQIQTNEDPELMQAVKQFLEETAPAEGVSDLTIQGWYKDPVLTDTLVSGVLTLDIKFHPGSGISRFKPGSQKQQVKLLKQTDGSWKVVSYAFQETAPDPSFPLETRIETYFRKHGNPPGVKSIEVVSFTPDSQTEQRIITGKVRLIVTLVPELKAGAANPYHGGINEMYVLMNKVGGVWDVEKIGPQPFKVSDAPEGVRDFEKVAQIMYGTLLEMQTSSREEAGKTIQRLHTIKLKVDKNATTSNDPDKGKELPVALELDLPAGYMPKQGDRVVLFLANGDPRVNSGMEIWIGKQKYFFYESDGSYHDLNGNTVDPAQEYFKLQSAR